MNALITIVLLVVANVFMTFAWYGHLKLQDMKIIGDKTALYIIMLMRWGIALIEDCFQVLADRIGFQSNGGSFSLMQLKVIQEAITLVVFTVFTVLFFRGEALHWNHFAAFALLIGAVYLVFMD